jgi:hypothetical protein
MDENEQLQELNREEAEYYVGGVLFVSITMMIGTIGNIHVLVVYAFRMKPSNPRIFILKLFTYLRYFHNGSQRYI